MVQPLWKRGSFYKIKHLPLNFTLRYLPKRNEILCAQKSLFKNIHTSQFYLKAEKKKWSHWIKPNRMDKQMVEYSYNQIPLNKRE